MQTITFYSYKGGLGRSLVLANIARYLARFGKKVVALDLDLEAPGLHYKLLPESLLGEAAPKGVVDFVGDFIATGEVPADLGNYVVRVPLAETVRGEIHLMPAGGAPSANYWHKLSALNLHDLFYREGAPGIPLFLELRERIRETYQPDFLLIDARTGITEIGGIATSVLPDKLVCILLNNRENLEGARAVLRSLRHVPRPPGSAPIEIVPVLSRLSPGMTTSADREEAAAVHAYLNAPTEQLADTLDLADPFVLHSEREFGRAERVLLNSSDELQLPLRVDYLRLSEKLAEARLLNIEVRVSTEYARGEVIDAGGSQLIGHISHSARKRLQSDRWRPAKEGSAARPGAQSPFEVQLVIKRLFPFGEDAEDSPADREGLVSWVG